MKNYFNVLNKNLILSLIILSSNWLFFDQSFYHIYLSTISLIIIWHSCILDKTVDYKIGVAFFILANITNYMMSIHQHHLSYQIILIMCGLFIFPINYLLIYFVRLKNRNILTVIYLYLSLNLLWVCKYFSGNIYFCNLAYLNLCGCILIRLAFIINKKFYFSVFNIFNQHMSIILWSVSQGMFDLKISQIYIIISTLFFIILQQRYYLTNYDYYSSSCHTISSLKVRSKNLVNLLNVRIVNFTKILDECMIKNLYYSMQHNLVLMLIIMLTFSMLSAIFY